MLPLRMHSQAANRVVQTVVATQSAGSSASIEPSTSEVDGDVDLLRSALASHGWTQSTPNR